MPAVEPFRVHPVIPAHRCIGSDSTHTVTPPPFRMDESMVSHHPG